VFRLTQLFHLVLRLRDLFLAGTFGGTSTGESAVARKAIGELTGSTGEEEVLQAKNKMKQLR